MFLEENIHKAIFVFIKSFFKDFSMTKSPIEAHKPAMPKINFTDV